MGIPERLVEIREANGYTRKKLAEELGRPYATVTKYETGEREPGHTYIIEIAKKIWSNHRLHTGDRKIPRTRRSGYRGQETGWYHRKLSPVERGRPAATGRSGRKPYIYAQI